MLFISTKKLFSFSRYSSFCISDFPLAFCFREWLKINLKTYDVINCLNKNLITRFIWYLEKEKRYDIETLSTDKYWIRSICMKKPCRKCAPKRGFQKLTLFFFRASCHLYVTRMYLYVTRMYSYVIRMSLVCNYTSSVCYSYVLVCHPYVTRMWFYHEPFWGRI